MSTKSRKQRPDKRLTDIKELAKRISNRIQEAEPSEWTLSELDIMGRILMEVLDLVEVADTRIDLGGAAAAKVFKNYFPKHGVNSVEIALLTGHIK